MSHSHWRLSTPKGLIQAPTPRLEATAPVDVGGIAFSIWLPALLVIFNLLTPVNIYKTPPIILVRYSNLAHTTSFFIE